MFKHRSNKQELLDGDVREKALILNLKELHTINKLLGGYAISIKALKQLKLEKKTIIDIGSGGGDMLNEMYKLSELRKINCRLIGVDLKPECTAYAKSHLPQELEFIQDDYRNILDHADNVDIIHACLFTHHLSNSQIIELIQFAIKSKSTLVINDLHRNFFAYYSIKLLTSIFSKSYLVKNDAPLSVLRGFKKKEWINLLEQAGAKKYTVKWKWAFRHLIIVNG
jgi:2-polyprenyl-3-methyl-5-hydroxy-6-metoxy-1,4-benzoquinol methylase